MTTPRNEIEGMLEACALNNVAPRVHGNGFIQIDCPWNTDLRINVWGHPDIPKQKTPIPIHDHRFSFESKIYKGMLTNVQLTFSSYIGKGATHEVYNVRCSKEKEDTQLFPTGYYAICTSLSATSYRSGETYIFDKGTFHETMVVEPTITVIRKLVNHPEYQPRVMIPVSIRPDNEFSRDSVTPERLWGIVHEVLRS